MPKYCISDSFVDYESYSISSMGFLPTGVDIMVIWIKFQPIPVHFSSLIPKMPMLDRIQFTLIHGPNIQGSYALLFFATSDFTFITRHSHYWVLSWMNHLWIPGINPTWSWCTILYLVEFGLLIFPWSFLHLCLSEMFRFFFFFFFFFFLVSLVLISG